MFYVVHVYVKKSPIKFKLYKPLIIKIICKNHKLCAKINITLISVEEN